MNINGTWVGYYEYGVGYELPYFGSRVEIEINLSIDSEGNLTGKVNETPSEFSVDVEATVRGFIDQTLISFIKMYPLSPIINPETNKSELTEGTLEIRHTGFIDEEHNAIYGDWLIEDKFVDEEGYNDVHILTGIWLLNQK